MRVLSLVAFVVACAGCGASGPAYQLRVEVDPALRAQARAEAQQDAREEAADDARVEARGEVGVEVDVPVEARAEVEAEADVEVEAEADVDVEVEAETEAEAQAEAEAEAAVVKVEFFGIRIDDARDVVFVLDRSGSMSQRTDLRIAPPDAPADVPEDEPPDAKPADASAAVPGAFDDDSEESADLDLGDVDAAEPGLEDPDAAEPALEDPDAAEPALEDPDAAPEASDAGAAEQEAGSEPDPPLNARKIDVAQAELVAALERLPEQTRLNILFFNQHIEAVDAELISLEDAGRDALVQFVLQTGPTGNTALAPAMRAAFLMGARRIVLLSDGLGNVGGDAAAVLRDAREGMRGGVRIDTIGLGANQDAELLETLARESGGLYQSF